VIQFNEVLTRDGFQMEPQFIETANKVALIDALSLCGYHRLEVTSFTSAKAIPMLRDAEIVMGQIKREPGVIYTVLVPNVRGAQRALESKADELNLVMSVSPVHNQMNLRMSCEDSFTSLTEVIKLVDSTVPINVSLSCSFGCPILGEIQQQRVLQWAQRFIDMGVCGITLCDTTGMAHPGLVAGMAQAALALGSSSQPVLWTMHFHNTRGMGLANVLAALQNGITSFDGSLGGLGGCPYAPGATGNVCTEDMVHMVQAMGLPTSIRLPALLDAARGLPALLGHEVPGQVMKAGRSCDLHQPLELHA
jgi:hydroxymethylglutaryl-CoA lyase